MGNELLLAFVATDQSSGSSMTVRSVSGGGLTWVLVVRANAQKGTAEIWRALAPSALTNVTVTATLSQSVASSMTVMSFAGVNTSGTNGSGAIGATKSASARTGAPTATLVTTQNSSWVFGVGNDYDNALARIPGAGQSLVHQNLAPVGDTYWVQMQNSPTLLSGTSVSINDTAPTTDQFNLSAVEVLPASSGGTQTWGISGTVSPSSIGSGTTLTLSGAASGTVTADTSGNYTFGNLANGTYTVTPSKAGYTFTPSSQSVTINGATPAPVNFTGQAASSGSWSISGTISPTTSGAGSLVTLTGAASGAVTADASGNYSFTGLANGTYTVSPSKSGYTFSPASRNVTINGNNVSGMNFTAQAVPTWSISGTISPASSGTGTLVTLSGSPSAMTTADTSGNYSFTGLVNGTYTVTPSKAGYTFSPANQNVTINGNNATGVSFTAQAGSSSTVKYPDLRDIIPPDLVFIEQTSAGKMLQYTHDTFNGGPGPLVIQPVYNPASGNYQGTQYIYSLDSSGRWSLTQQLRLAGAFLFDADHGHFHFPLASYGLYAVAADGSIGAPIALSGKVSFCINDSFLYDPTLPNAGALGNLGSCSDPTSLRGLNIGAADEYDRTDAGQSIDITGVPDGNYWLRAIDDPDNYFAESDKTNNETDVEISISGTTVQVLKTVTPALVPPPAISVTSPVDGVTVSGNVQLNANTSTTSGVQYLVDGQPLGTLVNGSPYTLSWDSRTVPNGTHWLAAQTTGSSGRIGSSAVVAVTVANSGTNPPTVQITSPTAGSTVSATVTLAATVASSQSIASVAFFVDSNAVGAPVTTPPYNVFWDTQTMTAGQHVITATATDITGSVGTSPPVSVTVDNSHPAKLIGQDAVVSVDGTGTMTTPAFSTSNDGELLIAFVAYDGPASSPQTATVSGAGLGWILLKRSNSQAGTAEIWAARGGIAASGMTVLSQPGVGGSTYHGSLTVVAFANASGPGIVGQASAPSGAPDIYLPGVSAGNWVFAVGNDWDNAVGRTPISGQVLVHQRVDTQVGDSYWVQSTAAPSTSYGLVDIHDSAPTTDRWNYAAVEIVATPQ